jgi:hypothetical protein
MIIFSIFAGRQKYLSILKRYIDRLLSKGLITEVHLWNYTKSSSDSEYLTSLCSNPSYKILTPTTTCTWNWNDYYDHYANSSYGDDDILVKCDDDIVYIDVDTFERFIGEIKGKDIFYPNIVNNDVCAYIQSQNGVHDLLKVIDTTKVSRAYKYPLTEWYTYQENADKIHALFLEDPDKFRIEREPISWPSRISINMFALRFEAVRDYFKEFKDAGYPGSDEEFISAGIWSHRSENTNMIVPYFTIVHFSFQSQNPELLDIKFLQRYQELYAS